MCKFRIHQSSHEQQMSAHPTHTCTRTLIHTHTRTQTRDCAAAGKQCSTCVAWPHSLSQRGELQPVNLRTHELSSAVCVATFVWCSRTSSDCSETKRKGLSAGQHASGVDPRHHGVGDRIGPRRLSHLHTAVLC